MAPTDIENLTVKTVDTYGAERGARVSDNGIKHFARDGQQAYDRSSVLLAYLKASAILPSVDKLLPHAL